jgi:hypothetical protein
MAASVLGQSRDYVFASDICDRQRLELPFAQPKSSKMLVQSLTTFATPAPSDVPELRSNTALLMSFEGSIADGHGAVSAATRFSLMRLFRALGGAVAVFSEHDPEWLSRTLGLQDIPLIYTKASSQNLASQLDDLLQSPPFAGRRPVLCGASAAAPALREGVLHRGGVFADQAAVRSALGDWLEGLAPMPVHQRAHA